MKKSVELSTLVKHKKLLVNILFGTSLFIMFLGLYFCFFSMINNINIKVLNSSIHGVIFGVLVFYLGIKYYLSVKKLQMDVSKNTAEFSWHNFKKVKTNK